MQYGSLFNLLQAESAQREPQIGDGATYLAWSDRYAYTIVDVIHYVSGKQKGEVKAVVATRDIAKRTDSNGMSDSQGYEYTTNPDATRQTYTKRKDGKFILQGNTHGMLAIGYRDEYYDFSF
jgi:hypothetical protein